MRELADIMAQGNVVIPAPVIRAKVLPQKAVPRKRELKPRPEAVKPVAVPPVMSQTQEDIPEYYTPDKPDTEL